MPQFSIERLEQRQLLSVSIGNLTFVQKLTGTSGDDHIWFSSEFDPYFGFTPEFMPHLLVAHVNDSTYLFDTRQPLRIDGGGGNDRIEVPRFLSVGRYFLSPQDDYISIRVRVNGGDGNDTIIGGAHSDTLDGGAGNDLLIGDGGDDLVRGGIGNDTIVVGAGKDRIFGNEGIDTVDFSKRTDNLNIFLIDRDETQAFGGDPNLIILRSVENVLGGSGNDSIQGDDADNFIDGGAGNDTLLGNFGDDTLNGNLGDDTFFSADANTSLLRPADHDVLIGGGGIDTAHVDQTDHMSGIDSLDLMHNSFDRTTLVR